ncbi:MAG TPA: hypothetical protein VH062_07155 [Polyangiaceae bacterium]|jgi:hypothetical protein|nr:hypothetical protein [Polyangiaceae bacterium]
MLREKSFALLVVASALFSAGCTTSAQPVVLRSLEASGKFSSLCLGTKNPLAIIPTFEPRNIDQCPDTSTVDGEERHAFSMVTQTTRGEVALVDLTLGLVSDSEPSEPGYNFLTVGSQPTGIVSTPGSLATFVGVGEIGKEGIFALPTSCVVPRPTDAPLRDLTTWPACRLPSAPGEMALVIDTPGDPSMPDLYRQHCGEMPTVPVPQSPRECPADLSSETQLPGRRKLVVSLPERKELVVIDAQDLLDRDPGKYEPCDFEQQLPLTVRGLPTCETDDTDCTGTVVQIPPADLDLSKGTPTGLAHRPHSGVFDVQPGGFAQIDDPATKEHRLFVADYQAPVIHEVDTTDVCALAESDRPLLPVSFTDPNRVVTTSRLAASPLTIPAPGTPLGNGQRFLYAIDELNNGSIMMFDISPGSTNRTPLLRRHSTILPFEPPDRIAFTSPARDVAFALRDHVEVDPATGTQQIGQFCNPDPSIPITDPGALYRPASDLSTGAAPNLLRGVFGFAALESGYVSVIDIQDFDAPCRRPTELNTTATENFRGCEGDPALSGAKTYVSSNGPTVTDEVTCNAVEQHRTRSSAALRNDLTLGTHAPSLQSFPTLISDQGSTLPTNGTVDGLRHPRMLGVDFSATDEAQVWLGTTLFASGDRSNPLVIDPAKADSTSLVLSFKDPRVFSPQETFSAIYEGVTSRVSTSGSFALPKNGPFTLDDSGASFCDTGVQDEAIAKFRATHRDYHVDPADVDSFGTLHSDYVEITSDLLPVETDTYWKMEGASCGGADPHAPNAGFLLCQTQYGTALAPNNQREFRVVKATPNQLQIVPRHASPAQAEKLEELAACCFPTAVSYVVRASNEWVVKGSLSGYHHDEVTTADGKSCALSTDPLRARLQSRALEVSCAGNGGVSDCAPNVDHLGTIGVASSEDIGCVYSSSAPLSPVLPANDETGCIFDGLFGSFVIYKGSSPTVKDYEYDWTVVGGFSPLLVNLSSTSDTNTSPLAMVYSPARDALLVADGSTKGIVAVDLATFAITLIY